MKSNRGLTLLEVLAAAVLLAVMAAACLPLLHQATRDHYAVDPPFEVQELAELADDVMAHRSEELQGIAHAELPWPDAPDRGPVAVERLGAEGASHAWLVFTAGPWTACRWIEVCPDRTPEGEKQPR